MHTLNILPIPSSNIRNTLFNLNSSEAELTACYMHVVCKSIERASAQKILPLQKRIQFLGFIFLVVILQSQQKVAIYFFVELGHAHDGKTRNKFPAGVIR